MNIPFELFTALIGIFLAVGVISLWKKSPFVLIIVGAVIATLGIFTDSIIMGKIPLSSTSSGSTISYIFTDNLYLLDAWSKIFICLIGAVLSIVGGLEAHREDNSLLWIMNIM